MINIPIISIIISISLMMLSSIVFYAGHLHVHHVLRHRRQAGPLQEHRAQRRCIPQRFERPEILYSLD